MILLLVAYLAVLILCEWGYIAVARRKGWVTPASATAPATPLGGGCIILPAAIVAPLFFEAYNPQTLCIAIGATVLACMSFVDDMRRLPALLRLLVQLAVLLAVLYPLAQFSLPFYVGAVLFCTGYVNASNFMDGINGMLCAYSAVVIFTIMTAVDIFPARGTAAFTPTFMLILPGAFLALVALALFNFRRRALVFAGDVGSITTGFFIAVALVWLAAIHNAVWAAVFVSIFVTDTFCTFLWRLRHGEHPFTPHRHHLYQRLVAAGAPPLAVSAGYALVQAAINAGALFCPHPWIYTVAVYAVLVSVYFGALHMLRSRGR